MNHHLATYDAEAAISGIHFPSPTARANPVLQCAHMRRTLRSALPSLFVAGMLLATAAVLDAQTGSFRVNRGATQSVSVHSECRRITNSSPTNLDVFVPTQTAAEWQSFRDNPPAGVTLGTCTCSLPWGGTIAEGQSVTAYQAASVSGKQCASEVRTCMNGVLSGMYQHQSCYGNFPGALGQGNFCETCAFENKVDSGCPPPGPSRGACKRYLVNNDQASVNRRCQELGFVHGVVTSTFTSAEWCGTYSNAYTRRWDGTKWLLGKCVNGNVKQATCYLQ